MHIWFLVLIFLCIIFDITTLDETINGVGSFTFIPIGISHNYNNTIPIVVNFNFPYGIYGSLSTILYFFNVFLTGLILLSLIGFPIFSLKFFNKTFSKKDSYVNKYHFIIGISVTSLMFLLYGSYYLFMSLGIVKPQPDHVGSIRYIFVLDQALKDCFSFIVINIFVLVVFGIFLYLILKYLANKVQLQSYHYSVFIGIVFLLCFVFNLILEMFSSNILKVSFLRSNIASLLPLMISFCVLILLFGILIIKSKKNYLSQIILGITIIVFFLSILTNYFIAISATQSSSFYEFSILVFYFNHLSFIKFNNDFIEILSSYLIDIFLRPYFINLISFYTIGFTICPSIIHRISNNKTTKMIPINENDQISKDEPMKVVSSKEIILTPIKLVEDITNELYQAPDYETAMEIQQNGFPDYITFKQALNKGITTYEEWIKYQKEK